MTDTLRPFSASSMFTTTSLAHSHLADLGPVPGPSSNGHSTKAHSPRSTFTSPEPNAVSPIAKYDSRVFVRAVFDFDSDDPSALTFASGDVIEVITMLDSGWWDGVIDERRGWFPSNFVEREPPNGHDFDSLHERDPSDEMQRNQRGPDDPDDVFVMDDALARGWGMGDVGLEDLARQIMDDGEAEEEGDEFHQAARRIFHQREDAVALDPGGEEGAEFQAAARQRMAQQHREDLNAFGDFGPAMTDRNREETDRTVTMDKRDSTRGAISDAWIPSLTPDGQVSLKPSVWSRLFANTRYTTIIHRRAKILGICPWKTTPKKRSTSIDRTTTMNHSLMFPMPQARAMGILSLKNSVLLLVCKSRHRILG